MPGGPGGEPTEQVILLAGNGTGVEPLDNEGVDTQPIVHAASANTVLSIDNGILVESEANTPFFVYLLIALVVIIGIWAIKRTNK